MVDAPLTTLLRTVNELFAGVESSGDEMTNVRSIGVAGVDASNETPRFGVTVEKPPRLVSVQLRVVVVKVGQDVRPPKVNTLNSMCGGAFTVSVTLVAAVPPVLKMVIQ